MASSGVNIDAELWKIKKILSMLSSSKGNGTSMISLVISQNDQLKKINRMLSDEYSNASNIKSRVNRLSVLSAITSTQQRLKLFSKIPENGLIIYCGTIFDDHSKEKKITIDIEPLKPLNTSLYICDNKFHLDILYFLLENDEKAGFIIIDGKGCLFGILKGSHRETLYKLDVDLPKKHGRGGQSSVRFARIRIEKRLIYLKKIAELAVQYFVDDAHSIHVTGLILAGSAEFKYELNSADFFDIRLRSKILGTFDISYGGETGFNQAIELSSSILSDLKFIKEKKIIQLFFDEIMRDTNKYIFGIEETVQALESGMIEKMLCWENLDVYRCEMIVCETMCKIIYYIRQPNLESFLNTKISELELESKTLLVDWIIENISTFGSELALITDKTSEGNQFTKGFGGLGGILRYPIEKKC